MIVKQSIKIGLSLLLINSLAFGASNLESGVQELGVEISKSMINKKKTKLAIIEFSDLGDNVNDLGRYLAEKLISELFKLNSNGFSIIERRQLAKVLREQKLSTSGLIDAKAMQKVGNLLGVDAIVTGSIADLGNIIEINARVISVETGDVIGSASSQIPKVGNVTTLMGQNSVKVSSGSTSSSSRGTKQVSKNHKEKYFFENDDVLIEYKRIQKRIADVVFYVTFFNKTNKPLKVEYYPQKSYLTDNNGLKWNINSKQTLFTNNKITIDANRKIISQLNFGNFGSLSGTIFNLKAYYTINGKDIVVKFYDIQIPK